MKNSLASFALSAGLLIGGNAAAAVTSDRDATPAGVRLDSGTCLVVELSKSLNAKKLQPGDKVTAKVIQAVVVNGKVVIPRGSKLVGNVTETKAYSKEDPESRLGIIFGKAMMKNGVEVPVGAVDRGNRRLLFGPVDPAGALRPPQPAPEHPGQPPDRHGAELSDHGVPVRAIVVAVAGGIAFTLLDASGTLVTISANLSLFTALIVLSGSVAAMLLPFRRRDLVLKAGRSDVPRIAGIPTASVWGGLSTILVLIVIVLIVTHPSVFGSFSFQSVTALVVILAAGPVIYFIVRRIRLSQSSIDLSLAMHELPPE